MKKQLLMIAASITLMSAPAVSANAQYGYRGKKNVKVVHKVKKQGLSRKAQGAIIGGVAGAGLGYVIDGTEKGAIIGGLLGTGAGFLYGNHRDNTMPDYRPTVIKTKRVIR